MDAGSEIEAKSVPTPTSDGNRSGSRYIGHWLLIGGWALSWQLAYIISSRSDPTFSCPIIDARVYHDQAVAIANGSFHPTDAYFQPPGYTLFLSAIYRLVGLNPWVIKIVQALLGMVTCMLVYGIGQELFDRRAGLFGGLITAILGPLLYYNAQLLPVVLITYCLVCGLWLLLVGLRTGQWIVWLLLGIVLGMGALVRPDVLVLFVVALIALLMQNRQRLYTLRRTGFLALVIFGGVVIPIGPVVVRNSMLAGQLVFISTNAGVNFYLGNHAQRDQLLALRPGEPWFLLRRAGMEKGIRGEAGFDQYFSAQAVDYISKNPVNFLCGLADKAAWLLTGAEQPRNENIYVQRQYSPILAALIWRWGAISFPWGLLFPIALWSALSWRPYVQLRWVWLTLLLYGLAIIIFFPCGRYRAPLLPLLALLAAGGGLTWWRGQPRIRWSGLMVTALAAIVVNWPLKLPGDSTDWELEMQVAVAREATQEKNWLLADGMLAAVEQRAPQDNAVLLARGLFWLQKNDLSKTIPCLEMAVLSAPTSFSAHVGLASAYHRAGFKDQAYSHYGAAYDIYPYDFGVLQALADLLMDAGEYLRAVHYYQEAVAVNPSRPEGYAKLAVAYYFSKQYNDAWRTVLQAEALGMRPNPQFYILLSAAQADSEGAPNQVSESQPNDQH
ncbi:MAG: hypothetical protein HJJLKODD_01537 [Phycisphaerae bacterium]|nr:hypothetical protein [Phycisphaerae bacterium]